MRGTESRIFLQRLNNDSAVAVWDSAECIVIDPWISGPQIDLAPWFSKQNLQEYLPGLPSDYSGKFHVLITHPFTDHNHSESQKMIASKTLTTHRLYKLKSGDEALVVAGFSIRRYGKSLLHSLFEIMHISSGKRILISPHGFKPERNSGLPMPNADVWLTTSQRYDLPWYMGGTINLGPEALLKLATLIEPKRIIEIHQANKIAAGLVARLAKIKPAQFSELQKSLSGLPKPSELLSLPPGKTYNII
jgi:L-ascorbate metabolism protein UlaG (beta-lactamase superfamily)